MITIRRTTDLPTVFKLHWELFPGDAWEYKESTACWLMFDDGEPIGFATADDVGHDTVFMSRAGVLPVAQGKGLQKKLIRVRTQWARSIGADCVITYTLLQNYPTIINLLRTGFKFYTPAEQWVGPDVHYYIKYI